MKQTKTIPVPENELQRLQSVFEYGILNSENEEQLDALTVLASSIFNVPIVLITILDENRQWFKSNFGLSIKETERSISFCQYTIMGAEIFEVEDTHLDPRFKRNPLVTMDPHIRYYCGAPLINDKGHSIGSLALIDRKPNKLNSEQLKTLRLLAQQILNFFELHLKRKELQVEKQSLEERIHERTKELEQKVMELNQRDEKIVSINNELSRLIYKASHDLLGPLRTLQGLVNLAQEETNLENIHHYLKLIYFTEQKLDIALVNLLKIVNIKDASDFSSIAWDELFIQACKNAKVRVEGKEIAINLSKDVTHEIHSDSILLQMIFEELFVNSMQYNLNETVLINMRLYTTDEYLKIEFCDNGIGIREDEKGKIFEMFYKNLNSRGSGLGLYIVKTAVEKLKGKIYADSKRNCGTTFFIALPLNFNATA